MTDCLTDAPCDASRAGQYANIPAAELQQGRNVDSNKSKDVAFIDFGNIYAGLTPAGNPAPGNSAADTAPRSAADPAAIAADIAKIREMHTSAPPDAVGRLAAEAAAAAAASDARTIGGLYTQAPPDVVARLAAEATAAAGAAVGAGAAAGATGERAINASSGKPLCTDLSDETNCPMVFPPGQRPPAGWPTLPPEEGPEAAPKFEGDPPYPVFRPTIIEPPVRSPSNVFRPTPAVPVEIGPPGEPRENY